MEYDNVRLLILMPEGVMMINEEGKKSKNFILEIFLDLPINQFKCSEAKSAVLLFGM